ncbi:MAG: rod shape-determining protein RodA [Gammaproteobacteria bacterium]|nr:rod shape-determining protein RodA [Gammaproteobacteria bacterium]
MNRLPRIRADWLLALGLLLLCSISLLAALSASGGDMAQLQAQGNRWLIAVLVMVAVAQLPPTLLLRWSPYLYLAGLLLLIAVAVVGDVGKGAQRWLQVGPIRFQPSELMKLAVPMTIAWYFAERQLPPRLHELLVATLMILLPAGLIFRQPDLGTALLVSASGFIVIFLAGIRWRWIISTAVLAAAAAPLAWQRLHDYQRQRVLTFLSPESDPLGTGYHIIQSNIAIGSGGLFGKGFLNGTQSQLEFLPESATDFIFAVLAEEYGFIGILLLLATYSIIVSRSFFISATAQSTYGRLLCGSLTLTFVIYILVNIGMVSGLLPVVGVPLPLISYGGTSMMTLMIGFGLLMSIQSHRQMFYGESQ